MESLAVARMKDAPILAASGTFKGKPEIEHTSGRVSWKWILLSNPSWEPGWVRPLPNSSSGEEHIEMLERVKKIEYGAKDIAAFCLRLGAYENEDNFSSNTGR